MYSRPTNCSAGLFIRRRAAERCEHFVRDPHERRPAGRVLGPPLISYLRPQVAEQRELRHGTVQAGHVAQIWRDGHREGSNALKVSLEAAAVELDGLIPLHG